MKIKFKDFKMGMKVKVNIDNKKIFTGNIVDIKPTQKLIRVNGFKFDSGKDFPLWLGRTQIEKIMED